ncbi:MAG: CRTAC1 family protein, partial [Rickettsiales bacterium]|nr:CRTAC1 family protein [Rickettsiales bacterium]
MKNLYLIAFALLSFSLVDAQNTCEEALSVSAGITTVELVNGDQAPDQVCFFTTTLGDHGMWYTYQPSDTFNLVITSDLEQNTGGDTRIHVYTGNCDDLTCIAGDDDISGGNYLSIVEFVAYPEFTYTIAWDDRWQDTGFDFEIIENEYTPPPPPVPNAFSFTPLTYSLPGSSHGLVDMNGDYRDDILHISGNTVYIGVYTDEGLASVSIPTVEPDNSPSWSLAAGDIDGNGFKDLVYGGGQGATILLRSDDGLSFDHKFSDETAQPGFYLFSQRSNMVDINNDGLLDVFVCHDVEPNTYFINNGDDTFEFIQGGLGDTDAGGNYGSIWTDYDNDGDIDMFIAKCRGGNELVSLNQMHRNNGDGTFTEVASDIGLSDPIQTWSSAVGDFDNDGDMDIFVGASNFQFGPHKYMMNMGDGTFEDITESTGLDQMEETTVEWAAYDFDNDGYLDIIGAGNIIKNLGDGTFAVQDMEFPTTAAVGDINNDGFLDIVTNSGVIQINNGNDNNFLTVNLQGVESNYDGIGARIEVVTATNTQLRDVRSGEGFRSMPSISSHFGLGEDEVIETLTIRWPSGVVDVIENPEINTSLLIEEGSQPLSTQE